MYALEKANIIEISNQPLVLNEIKNYDVYKKCGKEISI
jgi:hypothetical protein